MAPDRALERPAPAAEPEQLRLGDLEFLGVVKDTENERFKVAMLSLLGTSRLRSTSVHPVSSVDLCTSSVETEEEEGKKKVRRKPAALFAGGLLSVLERVATSEGFNFKRQP